MKGTMNKEKRDEYRESLLDPAKQPKFTRHNSDILSLLDTIDELERKVGIAQEAFIWCDEMFTARDEMNSKVHCAPVRLSPITERVRQARKALEE